MPLTRRTLACAAAGILALGTAGTAATPSELPPAVNVLGGDGVAISGYDPVAYFVEGRAVRGRPEWAVERNGGRFLFASDANRRRFEADPEHYTPAYGGYCAYGTAQGYLVEIDPEAWTIVNDRLYLNYDLSVRKAWLADVKGYLAKADRHWPQLIAGR